MSLLMMKTERIQTPQTPKLDSNGMVLMSDDEDDQFLLNNYLQNPKNRMSKLFLSYVIIVDDYQFKLLHNGNNLLQNNYLDKINNIVTQARVNVRE